MADTNLQPPLFGVDSAWRPPKVGDLPSWEGAKRVAIDVETCNPDIRRMGISCRREGFVAGFSFAIEDGPAHYVPVRHLGGDNVEDPFQAWRYLADQCRAFKGIIVGANLQYDLDWLETTANIEFPQVKWFRDVQVADPIINELHMRYNLDAILERWGLPGKDETLLREAARQYGVDPKAELYKLPARFVGAYAERDATGPLQVLRRQERVIDEENLWDIYNLESKVLICLLRMRQRGVRIDQDQLSQVEEWSLGQEATLLREVSRRTGIRVAVGDVWKPEVLAPVLEHVGVTLKKTSKGKPNIDKFLLAGMDDHVGKLLLGARKVNKLRTTFAQSIRTHMVVGRIHCTFNQLRREKDDGSLGGAAYGRISSELPNLQQQPSRDEFASMWRSIYVPEDGCEWMCADYSQQEPRMTTHFSAVAGCTGADEMVRAYREDPDTDNHDMMTQLVHGVRRGEIDEAKFEKLRKPCKDIFLGLCYGMGGAKLARSIGLDTKWIRTRSGKSIEVAGDDAQVVLDQFARNVPFVQEIAQLAERKAKQRGFVRTIGGRLCRFPKDEAGNYDWTYRALNRLIQGSSADQTKAALVAVEEAGYPMQLQVHDELDSGMLRNREEMQQVATIMREVVPLRVPSKVDLEIGPNWGEIK